MTNWTTTNSLAQSHGVKMCIHGRSGIGKTMLLATAPKPCFLYNENGALALSRQNIERVYGYNRTDISYDFPAYQIKSPEDLLAIGNYFQNDPSAKSYFETICLDTLSEIAEFVLRYYQEKLRDGRQAYGEMADKITDVIKFFRDLPGYNVVFVAKQERDKDELGALKLMPNMPGQKMTRDLPYLLDEVLCLEIGELADAQKTKYRQLICHPDNTYFAKDRSGALASIEEPHLGKLITKIRKTNGN